MFDTMTLTKVVGAVCGSLLIYLFGAWAAESLYGLGEAGKGEETTQAYSVDTGEAAASTETASADAPVFADLYAKADAVAGKKTFGKCAACHKIDGTNSTGPSLNGVVTRPRGEAADFGYSDGMLAKKGEPWSPENLFAFLENPKAYVPGTKMSFAGLPKPEDRVNLIAYLATLN